MLKNTKAISAVLSTLIFLTVILGTAILLYSLVNENIENVIDSHYGEPLKLLIGNIAFNKTCITIHILNTGERDATIDKIYLNKEQRTFNTIDNNPKIEANNNKEIYIYGHYNCGCTFEIKVIFESGYSLWTMEKYH
jgi:hypothetical protein